MLKLYLCACMCIHYLGSQGQICVKNPPLYLYEYMRILILMHVYCIGIYVNVHVCVYTCHSPLIAPPYKHIHRNKTNEVKHTYIKNQVYRATDSGINYIPYCDYLPNSEFDTVHLSKKYGAHSLVQGRAVHVDRAANG